MIIGGRIKERLDAIGATQGQLARAIKVSPQAVSKMVTGETQESPKLYQIARFLKTTPEYLTGETDHPELEDSLQDRHAGFRGAPAETGDTVEIREFDLAYGLGATFINDLPVTGKQRVFSRSWLRMFTDSPIEYLFFATGNGDSMVPTIMDADIVLIDTFDRTPRIWDKLWAVEVGGMGMIKRLRPTKDGTGMRLLSSNPDVPEETVYDEEMRVIGRVVAIVRKT